MHYVVNSVVTTPTTSPCPPLPVWVVPPYHQWLLRLSAVPVVHLTVISTRSKMVYLIWIEINIPHLLFMGLLDWEAQPKTDGNWQHWHNTRNASLLPHLYTTSNNPHHACRSPLCSQYSPGEMCECDANYTVLYNFGPPWFGYRIWQDGRMLQAVMLHSERPPRRHD